VVAKREAQLRVILKNTKPVELIDVGKSFESFGEMYETFVYARGYEKAAGNAKLYLIGVRSGSIIADLKGYLDQASFIIDHFDVLAGFVANVHELVEFFRVQRPLNGESAPTRAEAERIARFVEPIAKDGGAQLNINVQGDAKINVTQVTVTSERANAIQNNVRRFLGPPIPESGSFEKEVLYLEQIRRSTKTSVGDRGIIENFSLRPVRLLFMTEEVKAAIMEKPQNPFRMSYVVDGIVSTARGEPALYKIAKVHEAIGPTKTTNTKSRKRSSAA
jgi:hypothetical protein